jgi:hypothetical protein
MTIADKYSTNLQRVVPVEKLLQYNLSTQIYAVQCEVPVMENCNGFTVRNVGTANVIVMGDTLAPNESKSVGGNRGEIFVGRIDLKFSGAGTTLALITQKYYMNIPRNNETL